MPFIRTWVVGSASALGLAGVVAMLLSACAEHGSRTTAASPQPKPTPTLNEPNASAAAQADRLARAASCLTQPPDSAEVTAWRARQKTAIAANLPATAACFPSLTPTAYVQVDLERRTATTSDVWIAGSSLTDCTITECVAAKLRSTALPEPPAVLPATSKRLAQVIVGFDANRVPQLRLSPTPDATLSSACADQSHLPQGNGRLNPSLIRDRVRSAAPQLRDCYNLGLARDPQLAGNTVFRFTVALDGSVENVELKSNSLPDCQAVGCMSDAVRGLHFDPPEGGTVTVTYPFRFAPID